jgi:rare lipoprotein A
MAMPIADISAFGGRILVANARYSGIVSVLASLAMVAGCGAHRPMVNPPAPAPSPESPPPLTPSNPPPAMRAPASAAPAAVGEFTEQGVASWYGVPFNGRRTSDGEIYDMFQSTAAHRTLPFGALVRVTNLNNGKQTIVRVNDRGPFVANRIIDLSYAAAVAIGMIGTGTAPVRLDLVGGPNPAVGLFGVQVGAFQGEENAARLREQLESQYSPVTIATVETSGGTFYRVRVGRTTSQELARELAERIRKEERLTAFVVRLDN